MPMEIKATSYDHIILLAPTNSAEAEDEVSSFDEEDDSNDGMDGNDDKKSMRHWLISIWDHCQEKLVHAYAVAGWLVSPIPEIYKDAKQNVAGIPLHLVGLLFKQLFSHCTGTATGNLLAMMLDYTVTLW